MNFMLKDFIDLINNNQGIVTLLIFFSTLFFGWISGIFSSLRRRPKLKIRIIDGPTLCTTFPTEKKHNEFDIHQTAISLYLNITNVGTSATSIENVSAGFRWHLSPLSFLWLKNLLFWTWIDQPVVTLEDFHYKIGENIKVYPSLFQGNALTGQKADTFLEPGRAVNGVVYFETPESWGGCFPSPRAGQTQIKVAIADSFGRKYSKRFSVPVVSLGDAKKYNPSFGKTLSSLRNTSSNI